MRGTSGLLAVFLVTITVVAACDRGSKQPDLSMLGPSSAASSAVLPIGSPQCPKGGILIAAGIDANGNGLLDAPEVVNASPICTDPVNTRKPNGYSSLVKIASEPTSTLHCAAGGLKVQSGTDANKNRVLDPDEIAYTEYVCNGTPGSSSAAGITVEVGPTVVPSPPSKDKKKNAKSSPTKTKQAAPHASGKTSKKAKAAPQPAAEKQDGPVEPAASLTTDSVNAKLSPEADASVAPAAPPKKAKDTEKASSSKTANGASSTSVAPKGWINAKVSLPQVAKVVYKIDGRYIIVRFTNLSRKSKVFFKYTVRWKEGQNGSWVDESTMEGIGLRLKPLDTLDREVLTHAQEVKDVVVELEVSETV